MRGVGSECEKNWRSSFGMDYVGGLAVQEVLLV